MKLTEAKRLLKQAGFAPFNSDPLCWLHKSLKKGHVWMVPAKADGPMTKKIVRPKNIENQTYYLAALTSDRFREILGLELLKTMTNPKKRAAPKQKPKCKTHKRK